MDDNRIPYRNAEGYPDPTAHKALNAVQDELERKWAAEARVTLIVRAVRNIAELGGLSWESGWFWWTRLQVRYTDRS